MNGRKCRKNVVLFRRACYHSAMKFFPFCLAAVLLVSCSSPSEFEQIPSTPFTTHLKKNRDESAPFLSHWENKDKTESKEAEQAPLSRRRVCLQLNDAYYQGADETDKKARRKLNKLRAYMGRTLRRELRRNPKLKLVSEPDKETDVLEVALLRAEDADTAKLLLAQGAGKMVAGGMLTDGLLTTDADKGYICMAAKVSAPDGTLLAELADFEYGGKEQSLTDGLVSAAAPLDPKLLIPYGYQRQTIDKWATELSTYLATGHFPVSLLPTSLPKVPKPADVVNKVLPNPADVAGKVIPTNTLPSITPASE